MQLNVPKDVRNYLDDHKEMKKKKEEEKGKEKEKTKEKKKLQKKEETTWISVHIELILFQAIGVNLNMTSYTWASANHIVITIVLQFKIITNFSSSSLLMRSMMRLRISMRKNDQY